MEKTININEKTHNELKIIATKEKRTLKEKINEILEGALKNGSDKE